MFIEMHPTIGTDANEGERKIDNVIKGGLAWWHLQDKTYPIESSARETCNIDVFMPRSSGNTFRE